MYCSHCGKKVNDTMLFCPFCGDPIVIPDQDDAPEDTAAQRDPVPEAAAVRQSAPEPDYDAMPDLDAMAGAANDEAEERDAAEELLDWSRARESASGAGDIWSRSAAEAFTPLKLDEPEEPGEDWRAEIERKKQAVPQEKKPPEMRGEEEPVRLEGTAPKLELDVEGAKGAAGEKKPARKHANTLVPPKTMDPDDISMDGKGEDFDDADAYDDPGAEAYNPGFVYEDEEEGSFFMRHLRSIVGLALFVILILMFVIYAFSKAGQISLARINLAWSTDAYSQLGYESYQQGQYESAGLFYERALQRDATNYSFASSAAMAYYEAKNTDKSAAMLKKCVEINPTLLEPYIYLLKLYPDAAQRPWDITQLLQQGYQQTGDSRLNVTG